MLTSVFLQVENNKTDVGIFGLDSDGTIALFTIVLAIATIALAIVTGLSLRKSKTDKLAHVSQFVMNIHNMTTKMEQKYNSLRDPNDCMDFAFDFLDILETLCFFNTKKYLTEDIIDFFNYDLKLGLTFYNWLFDIHAIDETLSKNFVNFMKTCQEYKIVPEPNLPTIFEDHRTKIKNMEKRDIS